MSSLLATAPAPGDLGAETDLLETFLPLRIADRPDVLGAVQIDQYYAAVRSTAATEASKTAQWTYLGLAGLFGVLTALSFRSRPSEADAGWTRTSAPTDAATAELTSRNEELTRRNEELTSQLEELTSRNERLGSEGEALRVELAAAAIAVENAERTAADAGEEEAARALEVLEARVIAAEDRAAEAERRLAELGFEGPPVGSNGHSMPVGPGYATLDPNGGPTAEADVSDGDADDGLDEVDTRLFSPVSAEAAELRARLARNAARRKRSADS